MTDKNAVLESLHALNPWWGNNRFRFNVQKRAYYEDEIEQYEARLIKVLIGARRVGKTSILYSIIDNLLNKKFSAKRIIFLSGDLREIQEIGIKKLIFLLAEQNHFNITKDEALVIIDEIQDIENWQDDVKFLHDNSQIKFILSGSSASLLARKSSKLTGRYQLVRVLPLSYREYLAFRKISLKSATEETLKEYLVSGGYPERIDKVLPNYLQDIVDSTIYRDLLQQFNIRNPLILEEILKLLADKVTSGVSIKRLAKDLGIDPQTAKNYIRYLESVYIIYPLYRYAGSNRISRLSPAKYYFNDTGVLNTLGIRVRVGLLAENAVFLEFLRRQFKSEKYKLFYEVIDGQEYDFSDGKNIYEVKFEGNKSSMDLERYELKGKVKEYLPKPILIGTKSVLKEIVDESIDVSKIDITKFLLGE